MNTSAGNWAIGDLRNLLVKLELHTKWDREGNDDWVAWGEAYELFELYYMMDVAP